MMNIRRRQTNTPGELSLQAIWHRGDDRRDGPDSNPGEDIWRRAGSGRIRNNRPVASPYPKFPDTGGDDDDETEKKPEVLPQQPTPKQPPQPSAPRPTMMGALRPDQDPEILVGPMHPAARVIIENAPWDRGGVVNRHFHFSPYTAPESELAIV